ncbi:MAG TPA: hypothetical protein DDW42_01595 [Desulfobacteraceae bacterium]|nr:hypothetical protein [Desulfobacteraceae bacterium]
MVLPGASPQCEDGFIMIAMELFDALIAIRIPGEQRQVLDFIIRKTYGFKKKADAIPLSQFVTATGIQKAHIHRAIRGLISRQIIYSAKRGTFDATIYRINKDYTKWIKVPKKALVPKKAQKGAEKGTEKVPKKATSKDNTKDNSQKKKDISAFPQKTGEKTVESDRFYLTKKKRKLKGFKLESFELFWQTFDWKRDKANAADAWYDIQSLTKELLHKHILPGARRYRDARPAIIESKHTPKWAQGWISSRRWEDEKYEDEKDGLNEFLRRHGETEKVVQQEAHE